MNPPAGEAILRAPSALQRVRQRRGLGSVLPLLGPAFVACIAYVDPGNFATNIAGGAKYGYMLLWVIVASNLTAMLVQSLSAKLGIATGRNLAEMCRDELPRWLVWGVEGNLVVAIRGHHIIFRPPLRQCSTMPTEAITTMRPVTISGMPILLNIFVSKDGAG